MNLPAWASETRYDIAAKPAAQVPRQQTYSLPQTLLEERFGLGFIANAATSTAVR